MRVYKNTADSRRVRYEHTVLAALAERPLSFRVAAPIPAAGGETVVSLEGGLAALFPRLEGERVERSSLVHARACGVALAELHAALRRIDPGPAPSLARYGDLDQIHANVPDPWALPRALPLEEPVRVRFTGILERLRERVPYLYATLPHQLCHNDFSPGNLLMRGDAVGAVLDFEFVGPDLRALDVCTCWYWLAVRGWNGRDGLDPQTVRAFLEGYAVSAEHPEQPERPLTPDELSAMADITLLRGAVSVIHREGRRRAGLDSEQSVLDRVELLLVLEDWLARHAPWAPQA